MGRTCDFPVFDADNHLYETEDAFTRHLPAPYGLPGESVAQIMGGNLGRLMGVGVGV